MPDKTTADFLEKHGPFAQAALMVHQNFSTGAYCFIAKYYGLTSHMRVFQGIIAIHGEETHMNEDLDSVRRRWAKHLRTWLDQNVKNEHPDEYAQLRGLV